MATTSLEPLLREAEKHVLLTVLRDHPHWTLGQLIEHVGAEHPRAEQLASLTLGELMTDPRAASHGPGEHGDLSIDARRLDRAKAAHGPAFDRLVHEVVARARRPVGAAYLRERLGGPRWKLQHSLRRLVEAGLIHRAGTTSATRYRSCDA